MALGRPVVALVPEPAACVPFGVLPKAVYNLWVAVAFMWGWIAALTIILLPIYENRTTFYAVMTCNTQATNPENKAMTAAEVNAM